MTGNPINLTDPTGNCPWCIPLAGGVAGGLIGGFSAHAYANYIYDLALSGRCGCEGQLLVMAYSRSQFVNRTAMYGATFGALFGAIPGFGDEAALGMAMTGVSLSSYGIVTAAQRIQSDPHNACAWLDLTVSVIGLATTSQMAYHMGVRTGVIVPVADVQMTGNSLSGFLTQIKNTNNTSGFETMLSQKGIQYTKSIAANGEPSYNLSGFSTRVQIRLHLNADGSIAQFRAGINLYPANPVNPFTVNSLDEATLRSLDSQLRLIYGKPNNMPPRPGGWDADFIDVFGYIYLDESGVVNGLRTDDVHIRPIIK